MNISNLSANFAQNSSFANSTGRSNDVDQLAGLPSNLANAISLFDQAATPLQMGSALRKIDNVGIGPQTRATDLIGTVRIDRVQNRDGSVTVSSNRILAASDVTHQTRNGPVSFPVATRLQAMGSIRLMPQQTANGAPATPTPAMEGRLLNLSQQIGQEVRVSSGIRTANQQAALRNGNNPNTVASVSQHNVGDAADISVNGMSGRSLAQLAVSSGMFERVNLYPTGAVHVDQRDVGTGTQYYEDWQRR